VARSLKAGMMIETLGVLGEDALIGFQCRFAVLRRRRKTVPRECDELVTILSLELSSQLSINAKCSQCRALNCNHTSTTIQ
jgi:hypothetical protein